MGFLEWFVGKVEAAEDREAAAKWKRMVARKQEASKLRGQARDELDPSSRQFLLDEAARLDRYVSEA